MEVETTSVLARGGTRYSSTSSLSSAATASSPQTLQTTGVSSSNNGTGSNGHSHHNQQQQAATAAVVCQTQGLNLAQASRESPPSNPSPKTTVAPIITTSIPVRLRPIIKQHQFFARVASL